MACGHQIRAAAPLPELVLISPGTRVESRPPKGWSDLVLKSQPRLESGDLDTLPSFASSTATLFRSVVLADVRPVTAERKDFRLARVGLALCVPSGSAEVVLSTQSVDQGHHSIGMLERKVLDGAEEQLKKARLVARGEHFAVLASPCNLASDGKHEEIYLFYAFCVEPSSGRLKVAIWASSADVAGRKPRLSTFELLTPGLVFNCGLDVKADRILGAIPVNWSFAMRSLPPGRKLPMPADLRPWLTDPRRMAAEPAEFEKLVRAAISEPTQTQTTHLDRNPRAR